MILDDDELLKVTGKKRPTAQARALSKMGIRHRVRPDGSLLVLWADIEATQAAPGGGKIRRREPDWSAVNAA